MRLPENAAAVREVITAGFTIRWQSVHADDAPLRKSPWSAYCDHEKASPHGRN